MKILFAISLAAGAAIATPAVPAASTATGRVVFVGPLPEGHTGTVKFDGEKPEVKPLVIDAEKSVGCVHEGSVDTTNMSLVIGPDGGLANVVVMVEVAGAKFEAPEEPVALDQKSCRFEPHVTVVGVGTTVDFHNSDEISHNVHTYAAKNDQFNKIIAAGSKETQKLDKADRIEIKCDIHPWMNSWLIVTDAPFFAVTHAKGEFHIEGLPAGTHKVEYWHEQLGKNKGEITVDADGAAGVTLEWGMEEKSSGGRRSGRR